MKYLIRSQFLTLCLRWLAVISYSLTLSVSYPSISKADDNIVNGHAAAPDSWLLSNGQTWHLTTAIAQNPKKLNSRAPKANESEVVRKAERILHSSSAKAIALIDGNSIVWSGYNLPADDNKRFLSYSIGKTITSIAIGELICRKKLSFDTKLKMIASEFTGTDLGEATVRNLLTMSSGTFSKIGGDTTVFSNDQNRDISAGKISILDALKSQPISSSRENPDGRKIKPGEIFDYHSTDPLALGIIINRVSGTNYANFIEETVLLPAGIARPGVIGQDHFRYGQADGNVRLYFDDWIRLAIWVRDTMTGPSCLSRYIRQASKTQIHNEQKTIGPAFEGYGYLIWTENHRAPDSFWALGYGGQRIAWNHRNHRILIAFSNVENYMDDLYKLYAEWSDVDQ
jgi:CubicO group peptidase (beta-lactamase class C family)